MSISGRTAVKVGAWGAAGVLAVGTFAGVALASENVGIEHRPDGNHCLAGAEHHAREGRRPARRARSAAWAGSKGGPCTASSPSRRARACRRSTRSEAP